ncbi:FtsX-like permease family protein (plasmid) [Streptomyces sp. BI20]|uniref:FtsX-like permease family protein n=1 Tax=Streptomyces sp. BI20 TaxID=3403460 RepID=UPI003C7249E9
MSAVWSVALGQMGRRPAAFVGSAAALFLAVASVTLFGSLLAADLATPAEVRAAVAGPGLTVIAGVFGELAVLVAFFTVAGALGFAVRRQHGELALLRTIAATPRQARRLVRRQVLAVVAVVALPGAAAGTGAARWFLDALRDRGMAAGQARIPWTVVPASAAWGAALLVGVVAAAPAARRITRIAPAAALSAASGEHARTGAWRLLAGLAVAVGGGLLLRVAATRPAAEADKAGQAALLGALVLLVAVALAGPFLARALSWVVAGPVRLLSPGTGWLADANLRGYARRLASAVVPPALLVGLAGTMTIMTTTAERAAGAATGAASATDVWLRQAELGLLVCFAAVSTVNTLVAVTADRRREFALLRLIGATRGRLLRMLAVESVVTTVVGVLLGGLVASACAGAFARAVTGSALPVVSAGTCGWIVAGAALLTVPAVLLTGVRAVRGPAAELVAGGRD